MLVHSYMLHAWWMYDKVLIKVQPESWGSVWLQSYVMSEMNLISFHHHHPLRTQNRKRDWTRTYERRIHSCLVHMYERTLFTRTMVHFFVSSDFCFSFGSARHYTTRYNNSNSNAHKENEQQNEFIRSISNKCTRIIHATIHSIEVTNTESFHS